MALDCSPDYFLGVQDMIKLSIDGNCVCALYGSNLQEGTAEFVELKYLKDDTEIFLAVALALYRLKKKLNNFDIKSEWA